MRPRGRIENGVLALLRQEPGTLDAVELAARIYHINPVPKAACSAVRRALSSLARKGLVCAGSRQHSNSRRRWYRKRPRASGYSAYQRPGPRQSARSHPFNRCARAPRVLGSP